MDVAEVPTKSLFRGTILLGIFNFYRSFAVLSDVFSGKNPSLFLAAYFDFKCEELKKVATKKRRYVIFMLQIREGSCFDE